MEKEKDIELLPSVKVGDILNLPITGWGKTNDPMLKIGKFIIFIEKTKGKKLPLGGPIKVKVTKVFKKFGVAELEK